MRDFEYSKIEHIIERIVAFYTFQKIFSKKIIFKASKVDFLRCFPLEMCNFCHKYDGRIFVGYYSRIWVRYEYVFDYKMSDTNGSKIVGSLIENANSQIFVPSLVKSLKPHRIDTT